MKLQNFTHFNLMLIIHIPQKTETVSCAADDNVLKSGADLALVPLVQKHQLKLLRKIMRKHQKTNNLQAKLGSCLR